MKSPKVKAKSKKRKGRGYGSGRGGHTAGRGMKGQKSRSGLHILFEGTKVKKSLLSRLPLQRGKGKFKAKRKPIVINLEYLNMFKSGEKVDLNAIIKKGIVKPSSAKKHGVKVLGNGQIKKKLTVLVPTTKKAQAKIEKAGGKVGK